MQLIIPASCKPHPAAPLQRRTHPRLKGLSLPASQAREDVPVCDGAGGHRIHQLRALFPTKPPRRTCSMIETRRSRGRAAARTGIKRLPVQGRRPSYGVETPRLTYPTAVASSIVRFSSSHPHQGLGHGRSGPAAMFHFEMRAQLPPVDVAPMNGAASRQHHRSNMELYTQ